jgi:hypothetical protein
MNSKFNKSSVLVIAMLAGNTCLATPFNSIDLPRTMALGGAGVASDSIMAGPLFNPALLSMGKKEEKVKVELPVLSIRAYDPDNFIDSIDNFQEAGFEGLLDVQIDQATILSPGSYTLVADAADDLSAGLVTLSGKAVQTEFGGATIIAIPSQSFGIGIMLNGSLTLGGVINYRDDEVLTGLASDVRNFDQCLLDNVEVLGSCDITALDLNYVNNLTGEVLFDSTDELNSTGDVRAVGLVEFGVSISRMFNFGGQEFAIGITPKYVQVEVFDYTSDVNSIDEDDFNSDQYSASYNNFNFDIGIARKFDNGISLGLTGKNLISETYDMQRNGVNTGNELKIQTQWRLGTAYQSENFLLVADLDLTENAPVGFGRDARYLGLGVEFNLWGWLQPRFGYRADLVNSERNTISMGLGLASKRLHFDVALIGSDNEIGGAAQFGFSF